MTTTEQQLKQNPSEFNIVSLGGHSTSNDTVHICPETHIDELDRSIHARNTTLPLPCTCSISTFLKEMDFKDGYKAGSQRLHTAFYKSKTFKGVLIILNLCILAVAAIVLSFGTFNIRMDYVVAGIAVGCAFATPCIYILLSYRSRLYR